MTTIDECVEHLAAGWERTGFLPCRRWTYCGGEGFAGGPPMACVLGTMAAEAGFIGNGLGPLLEAIPMPLTRETVSGLADGFDGGDCRDSAWVRPSCAERPDDYRMGAAIGAGVAARVFGGKR